MPQEDAEGMENSVDPDQIAPSGLQYFFSVVQFTIKLRHIQWKPNVCTRVWL